MLVIVDHDPEVTVGDWLTVEQRSRNMAAIRSRGTKPELRLASLIKELLPRRKAILHADLPGRPDYFFPGLQLAVFVDGCFWHSCPKHGHVPADNREYWAPKLERNRERDRAAAASLRKRSMTTVRIWEHDLRQHSSGARRKLERGIARARAKSERRLLAT